jgi:hypothetical protein
MQAAPEFNKASQGCPRSRLRSWTSGVPIPGVAAGPPENR